MPSRLLLSVRVPEFVIGITLCSGSESEEEEIYSTSSTMIGPIPMVCKGAKRGVELFISTMLKLRTLSLRYVMEDLHAVRKEGTAVKVSKRRLLRDRIQPACYGLYIRSHAQQRCKERFP
jgi:hypothetical protein